MKWVAPHLAQGTLQFPQEVIIREVNGLVVNVINPKFQFLHDLEVVVDDKLFGKLWAKAVLDFLCPSNLLGNLRLCFFFLQTYYCSQLWQRLKRLLMIQLQWLQKETNMYWLLIYTTQVSASWLMVNSVWKFSVSGTLVTWLSQRWKYIISNILRATKFSYGHICLL